MNFGSDNTAGIAPAIFDAIAAANAGQIGAYGSDPLTAEVSEMFSTFFERDVHVTLVTLGTAANALALSAITPPWGAVLCHHEAHINVDECGAPEMYSGGAKIVGVDGPGAKIDPAALTATLARIGPLRPHHVRPTALSLSQVTEAGRVYRAQEIEALAGIARDHGLKVHMDGARFANALVSLNASPADITWKAGVDVLCFGTTKAGAMAAEAIVCFDPQIADAVWCRGLPRHGKGRRIEPQHLVIGLPGERQRARGGGGRACGRLRRRLARIGNGAADTRRRV